MNGLVDARTGCYSESGPHSMRASPSPELPMNPATRLPSLQDRQPLDAYSRDLPMNFPPLRSRRESPRTAGSAAPGRREDSAHIAALTGVRALAALWVVLFHAWIVAGRPTPILPLPAARFDLTPLFAFGWLGVDVFFVLSGFLLTRQAWGKVARGAAPGWLGTRFGETYTSFLERRVLRVYPAYYATISVLLVLAGLRLYRTLPEKADLLLHLVMFHNLVERYLETMNGVFWTIPFEWQFYLVFPLLFVALRRTNLIAFYLAFALLALATKEWVIIRDSGYMQLQLPIRLDAFVAGMCAATFAEHHRLRRRAALTVFALGLAGLFGTPWIYSAYPSGGHYFDAVGLARPLWIQASICLFLLGLSAEPHPGVRLFSNRLVVWLGLISYSIYLVHVPVLDFLALLGAYPIRDSGVPISLPRVLATGVPAVIAASAALYYSIERPFQTSARRSARQTASSSGWRPRKPFVILGLWALAQFAFLVAMS
jgi:peptidoglycan/LPS O-acetylase OafA/YrhL